MTKGICKTIVTGSAGFIGGASRAAARIHNRLYKNNINSRLWVNEKLSFSFRC